MDGLSKLWKDKRKKRKMRCLGVVCGKDQRWRPSPRASWTPACWPAYPWQSTSLPAKNKRTNRSLKKSPIFHCATYTLLIEPITTFRGRLGYMPFS
jgi:hypothetical protein